MGLCSHVISHVTSHMIIHVVISHVIKSVMCTVGMTFLLLQKSGAYIFRPNGTAPFNVSEGNRAKVTVFNVRTQRVPSFISPSLSPSLSSSLLKKTEQNGD